MKLTQDAFEDVLGVRPVLTRSGGSIPIVASLTARGVPAIVTGFTRPAQAPLAKRKHAHRGPAGRARDGRRAPPAVRESWLTVATRARSPRSWARRCWSGSCGTSSSTRSRIPTRRHTRRRPSSSTSVASWSTSSARSGSRTSS